MKRNNKNKSVKLDTYTQAAINDIVGSGLSYGVALHGLLTAAQIQDLYLTFKGREVVKQDELPKTIKVFEAGSNDSWNNKKTKRPACYDLLAYGFLCNDYYAMWSGNRFYMYFEYHKRDTVIIRDELKHLIEQIDARAEHLKMVALGCVIEF